MDSHQKETPGNLNFGLGINYNRNEEEKKMTIAFKSWNYMEKGQLKKINQMINKSVCNKKKQKINITIHRVPCANINPDPCMHAWSET